MKSYAICEVKSLDGDDANGSFEAILSAATLDRDGEIIDAKAFEPLPERIPIDIDHGMTVATTVGSGVPYYDGDLLKIKASFSSIARAQEIRTLVTEGHIDRMSVTFMGAERDTKDGVPHVKRAELLNAAFVPIPSNREAAVLVAKAFAPTDAEVIAGTPVFLPSSFVDAAKAADIQARVTQLEEQVKSLLGTQTPEPATASAVTDPEKAAAPAAAKSETAKWLAEVAAAQAATIL